MLNGILKYELDEVFGDGFWAVCCIVLVVVGFYGEEEKSNRKKTNQKHKKKSKMNQKINGTKNRKKQRIFKLWSIAPIKLRYSKKTHNNI